ncbi:MAG: DNA recombination protein RmuC [Amphritea sp.]
MTKTQLAALFNDPLINALIGAAVGLVFGLLLLQLKRLRQAADFAEQRQSQMLEVQTLHQQIERFTTEQQLADNQKHDLEQQLFTTSERLRSLELEQVRLHQISLQKDELTEQFSELQERHENVQRQLSQRQAKVAELDSRLESEREAQSEKLQLLTQARDQLKNEFQNLANRIFEEKSRKFTDSNKDSLGSLLTPLREQLGDFKRRVEDVYDKEAKDRRSLHEQITQLKELNQQMSTDAVNLTNALKGESKTQGNWGEVILERVLEQSGLRKGYEYQIQVSLTEEGRRFQPDVIIRLPDEKDVVVDAKVSLTGYEKFCSDDDQALREGYLNEHLQSIRNHVRGLSDKSYQGLEGIRSLDFVLMFVPIEGAFLLALQQDQDLFSYAYERNIILVSPSTLLVTLRTINNIWRYERQNQNAQEIGKRGGELYDKFVGFVASVDEIGRHLGRTQQAYDMAHKRLVSGRGNLVNQAAALQQLGVKNRKDLDKKLTDAAAESDPSSDQLEVLD